MDAVGYRELLTEAEREGLDSALAAAGSDAGARNAVESQFMLVARDRAQNPDAFVAELEKAEAAEAAAAGGGGGAAAAAAAAAPEGKKEGAATASRRRLLPYEFRKGLDDKQGGREEVRGGGGRGGGARFGGARAGASKPAGADSPAGSGAPPPSAAAGTPGASAGAGAAPKAEAAAGEGVEGEAVPDRFGAVFAGFDPVTAPKEEAEAKYAQYVQATAADMWAYYAKVKDR